MRRAQISLFIVFGVLLIAVFVALLMFSNSFDGPVDVEVRDSNTLKVFIDACVKDVSSYALFILGRQGGYTMQPTSIHHLEPYGAIGYAFYKGENTLVTTEQMQQQFNTYMEQNLPSCLNDFSEFGAQGIVVDSESITSNVLFAAKDTQVTVTYPLRVTSGDATVSLDTFTAKHPVRVRHLHDISFELAQRKVLNPEYLDMTFLGEQDVNATIITDENGDQVIVFEDARSILNTRPYRFLIAVTSE